MSTPETAQTAPVNAYDILTAVSRTSPEWAEFVPYVVAIRSPDDDAALTIPQMNRQLLIDAFNKAQTILTADPKSHISQRNANALKDELESQEAEIATLENNRSIELGALLPEVTDCLKAHNYTDTVRIPDHSITDFGEVNGARYVGFLVRPSEISKLEQDKCFKAHKLVRVMPPHVA